MTPGFGLDERSAVVIVAALVVLFRSLPFALYEQIQFDSDQAVFGLMAKHLSEGRAFPLFMYGNSYLLAVEAWLAAPWLLVAPLNITTLSLSLLMTNVAAAVVLVICLERWGGLRPIHALIASLFFVLAPPIVSGDLASVSGGNVEPFLYIALLWMAVDRPFLFGLVLALGFLQREFTMYAVPVLLARDVIRHRGVPHETARKWLLASVMFLGVWQGIQSLQPYADLMGPGTRGELFGGFAGSQIGNLLARVDASNESLPARLDGMMRIHLPRLLGALVYEDGIGRMRARLAWVLAIGFAVLIVRFTIVVVNAIRREGYARLKRAGFGWYLLAVGFVAATGYMSARPVTEEYSRYGLLVVMVPMGLSAAFLALEPDERIRKVAVAAMLAWGTISAIDSLRLYGRYWDDRPKDLRVLADTLVARNIRAAYAPYWTAYAVTFMTGERVKVASTDFIRIEEYQRFARSQPDAIDIREQPCEGGDRVARWYLCQR